MASYRAYHAHNCRSHFECRLAYQGYQEYLKEAPIVQEERRVFRASLPEDPYGIPTGVLYETPEETLNRNIAEDVALLDDRALWIFHPGVSGGHHHICLSRRPNGLFGFYQPS
jgi:hypothetical protein